MIGVLVVTELGFYLSYKENVIPNRKADLNKLKMSIV